MNSKIHVPPIKSQGIKTKLVPWIKSLVPQAITGRWIEPFMGTGVVGFNVAPNRALMCDTNPHLINFYNSIQREEITPALVRKYLMEEGDKLLEKGEEHYYVIRERFNLTHQPLDFLFLNRAGFNGMIRFNRKGEFNIPFCRKPNRFAQAYITKIVNQVDTISQIIKQKEFTFKCQPFDITIQEASKKDIIYCDPPYIERHVDYFNGWNSQCENLLFEKLDKTKCQFILSTWHHNDFRKNEYIEPLWSKFNVLTQKHFYHVGGREKNRNPMVEAIITNIDTTDYDYTNQPNQSQLLLDVG